jgi:hypothetical protein
MIVIFLKCLVNGKYEYVTLGIWFDHAVVNKSLGVGVDVSRDEEDVLHVFRLIDSHNLFLGQFHELVSPARDLFPRRQFVEPILSADEPVKQFGLPCVAVLGVIRDAHPFHAEHQFRRPEHGLPEAIHALNLHTFHVDQGKVKYGVWRQHSVHSVHFDGLLDLVLSYWGSLDDLVVGIDDGHAGVGEGSDDDPR